MKLIIRLEAETDLLEAVNWYEEKVKGLGSSLILSFEAAIEIIQRTPEVYPKVYKNIRRVLMRKFPYGIHYIVDKENIIILAMFHFNRNPNILRNRVL